MKILFTHDELDARTKSLAIQLNAIFGKYEPGSISCVPLLQGAARFFVDTSKHLQFETIVDFAGATSYQGETQKDLVIYKLPNVENVKDKVVLLFDDILDTGRTIDSFAKTLYSMGAKEVIPVVLLRRANTEYVWDERIKRHFVGFNIGDEWVYGYGMDGEGGLYRTLNEIAYNEKG
jgi:hypoxanthine phosphoribosyltransferase